MLIKGVPVSSKYPPEWLQYLQTVLQKVPVSSNYPPVIIKNFKKLQSNKVLEYRI